IDNMFGEPIVRIDSLGRLVYIGAILFAALTVIVVLMTVVPRIGRRLMAQEWLFDAMRGAAVVLFFFVVCEIGFISLPLGIPATIPPAWELVYWVIPSGIYLWMTVLRKRKWLPS